MAEKGFRALGYAVLMLNVIYGLMALAFAGGVGFLFWVCFFS
jgi:hypothetical protein